MNCRPHQNRKRAATAAYRPPYAAIVVDDKSGFVLHEVSANEPRHPASLTKIMTLYLLFEQLEVGKLKLDTPSPISTRAAAHLDYPSRASVRRSGIRRELEAFDRRFFPASTAEAASPRLRTGHREQKAT